MQESYDPRNGGFGGEPKFPYAEAIELLFAQSTPKPGSSWRGMAERSLEGMLAGELADPVEGGFFRYALSADWTSPALREAAGRERGTAPGICARRTGAWPRGLGREQPSARSHGWNRRSKLPNGLWGASQAADDEYFAANASGTGRPVKFHSWIDVVLTNRNAEWILALADAGGRLGHAGMDRARPATRMTRCSRRCSTMASCITAARRTPRAGGLRTAGRSRRAVTGGDHARAEHRDGMKYLDTACELVRIMEATLWADEGGFRDHPRSGDDVGALRYPGSAIRVNAAAARIVLDLSLITGQRSYHALAERTLAVLSPLAGRYGVSGAASRSRSKSSSTRRVRRNRRGTEASPHCVRRRCGCRTRSAACGPSRSPGRSAAVASAPTVLRPRTYAARATARPRCATLPLCSEAATSQPDARVPQCCPPPRCHSVTS